MFDEEIKKIEEKGLRHKIVYVEFKGKKEPVLVKQLTFRELASISRSASKVKYVNDEPTAEIDIWASKELTLIKGVVAASFPVGDAVLDQPADLVSKLLDAIEEVCSPLVQKPAKS